MLSHLKSWLLLTFFRPNIPLEVKEAKCKKHCLFLLYQKLWPFQTLAQFMWSKQETGDLSTTIWCKIIDLRSNTGKTSPFHFWYFQYSKIKSPPGPIWLTFPITLQIFHKNVAKGTSDPRWVLWLIQHLEFKAEASTSFEILVKLQIGSFGKGREIHRPFFVPTLTTCLLCCSSINNITVKTDNSW